MLFFFFFLHLFGFDFWGQKKKKKKNRGNGKKEGRRAMEIMMPYSPVSSKRRTVDGRRAMPLPTHHHYHHGPSSNLIKEKNNNNQIKSILQSIVLFTGLTRIDLEQLMSIVTYNSQKFKMSKTPHLRNHEFGIFTNKNHE